MSGKRNILVLTFNEDARNVIFDVYFCGWSKSAQREFITKYHPKSFCVTMTIQGERPTKDELVTAYSDWRQEWLKQQLPQFPKITQSFIGMDTNESYERDRIHCSRCGWKLTPNMIYSAKCKGDKDLLCGKCRRETTKI